MSSFERLGRGVSWLCCIVILSLSACATPPTDPQEREQFEQNNDPLEPLNRGIFAGNQIFDQYLLRPLAVAYRDVVPEFGRTGIHHFLVNLREPVVFANAVLQGEGDKAGTTFARFFFNSTVGVFGLADPATSMGLKHQIGDFGQTLDVWGAPEGPYLVLPIIGPSNFRDAVGYGVDEYLDPMHYYAQNNDADEAVWGRFILDGLDRRSRVIDELDDLKKNSLDFYAQLRSIVRQHRAAELGHPLPTDIPGAGGLYDDPQAPTTAAAQTTSQ
jgi:phospholipid-binding lipoprotein MlaA